MTSLLHRPRRLRNHPLLREAIAETVVFKKNLMLPLFVADIRDDREIQGMPGVYQRSVDSLTRHVERCVELGITSFILFGVPSHKDAKASSALEEDTVIVRALRSLKKHLGSSAFVATDVCLCSYTDHGHCGILVNQQIANDPSIELLRAMAVLHAQAGADMVAPSDMMDGRVGAIRHGLDKAGLVHTPIMSYAVKYASSLYGPFRHAADSAPKFGDRRGYQMDFRNTNDAVREAQLDIQEGADILMVKPGLAYLDIVAALRTQTQLPLACYQVSGEYSMIRYAAQANAIDEAAVVRELWVAMRRAGANIILTYHAAIAAENRWIE